MIQSWFSPLWIQGEAKFYPSICGFPNGNIFEDNIFLQTYILNDNYFSTEHIIQMKDKNINLLDLYDLYLYNWEVPSQLIDNRKICIINLSWNILLE